MNIDANSNTGGNVCLSLLNDQCRESKVELSRRAGINDNYSIELLYKPKKVREEYGRR